MSKNKNKGLGSKLETLLPEDTKDDLFGGTTKPVNTGAPLLINVSQIDKNPYQPREKFPQDEIIKLSSSIKDKGIIEPLVVIKVGDRFQLIAGHRRLMAAKHAKLDKVPVIINERQTTPLDQLELALVENVLRQDLNPIEEGKAYERLGKEFSKSTSSIAELVKKDRSTVENSLRLLKLPEEVKTEIEMGRLSTGHGKVLLGLGAKTDLILKAKNDILTSKMTVRQTESLVKKLIKQSEDKKTEIDKPDESVTEKDYYESLEKKISDSLGGLKISINYTGKNKKLEILYHSVEDFELILSKLNINID